MADNNKPAANNGILIEMGRLSFDSLFEPDASVEGGKLKYRANILIDPNTDVGRKNIKKIENAIRLVELEKFGKSPAQYKSEDRKCFFDGDDCLNSKTQKPYDGYAGMKMLKAISDKRPSVVDRDKSPLTADDGKPYAGSYNNFFVRIYGVKGADKGGNGCFCSLECVQFAKDGEPFGAAPVDPNSVFKDISGDDDNDIGDSSSASNSGDEVDDLF